MFNMEERWFQRDLIAVYYHLNGAYKKGGDVLLIRECRDRVRGNGFKLNEHRFRLDLQKFFTGRVLRPWNRLLREVVDVSSLKVFKIRLDGTLSF